MLELIYKEKSSKKAIRVVSITYNGANWTPQKNNQLSDDNKENSSNDKAKKQ